MKIECIAALANLAVNDENEMEIIAKGGHVPIIQALKMAEGGGKASYSNRAIAGYSSENIDEVWIYIHAYIHTYTHAYTHTYIYIC